LLVDSAVPELGGVRKVNVRRTLAILAHVTLWTAALLAAFLLRFEFELPRVYWPNLPLWATALVLLRMTVFQAAGLFRGLWRYTGSRDYAAMLWATSLASIVFWIGLAVVGHHHFPRSVLVIEWSMAMLHMAGARFATRALYHMHPELLLAGNATERRTRVLIVGAGDGAEMLLREMLRLHAERYEPIGLVDDDPAKHGARIHGVRILGAIPELPRLVTARKADEILIAVPTATGMQMRRIVDYAKKSGARIKTIPALAQLLDGRVHVSQLRNVNIEDLLGRDPVQLDGEAISIIMSGQVVMVTGAGGSIGSEICRQVCRFQPALVLLVERAENNLFHIHRELLASYPEVRTEPCIADVGDAARMEELFAAHGPNVVFHAAAHKHVPMMEWNPGEAVKNNVFGTKTLADLSDRFRVSRFVMISTDKAVNPTSVMGVSKRVAEIYVQTMSERSSTRFVTVRFGNVLGSAGSVIPIFQEQIASGGPVTVTHPEMQRYFMTIPEASQLVLQAGAMGNGGEIFILDMGEPVRIADLARDLITLSGLTPGVDIEIKFTGMRPGEKLFEELSVDDENAGKTGHPKIFVGNYRPHRWDTLQRDLQDLLRLAEEGPQDLRKKFAEVVPEYGPGGNRAAPVPARVGVLRAVNG
jgi:FlaA1/EpsC-like NDP-sugar epimerase